MIPYLRITAAPVPDDATEHKVVVRDGVALATDVYLPSDVPGPHPAILIRLPYDKDGAYCFMPQFARLMTRRGYAAVIQDVRGKFRSEGATEFGRHEVDDGWDTIEWIVSQPWSDGNVAMCGDSYYGYTSLAAAMSGHPALKAIAPRLTGTQLSMVLPNPDGTRDVEQTARRAYLASIYIDHDTYEWEPDWSRRPLRDGFEEFFAELGKRSAGFDAEFEPESCHVPAPLERLLRQEWTVPILFTVGWFDNCASWSWHDIRALAESPAWSQQLHLRMEPIDHENSRLDDAPAQDASIGEDAIARVLGPTLDFFDRVVRGLPGPPIPRVHYEVCHGDVRTAEVWPPKDAHEVRMFMTGHEGERVLTLERPATSTRISWNHDPADPVPSIGRDPFAILGDWHDIGDVGRRVDVVQFRGPAAEHDQVYAGPVSVRVPFESSVQFTHLHARLLDIDVEGRAFLIAKGQTQVVVPGNGLTAVDLLHVGYRLRRGHRLALQLMSSDFPDYVLAPGDGGDPFEAVAPAASRQTIGTGESAVLSLWALDPSGDSPTN
ncbi:CocE/NonD family hydrolase [Nonomuraea turcica]|uniref:CocE/NonD family hydrolase n=1 Tax=Nonomuraea sp. G32 TaxID=3067274 RepID=UPI00273CCD55|nr:CocE/NonD family hydrolase [Nonomuraea sp. G32]MDP4502548.1 CocE/NonD family hydrolase [Nonomuraea sp. G32]